MRQVGMKSFAILVSGNFRLKLVSHCKLHLEILWNLLRICLWSSEVVCRFLLESKEGTVGVEYAQDKWRVIRCGKCFTVRIGFPTVEGPVHLSNELIFILLRILKLSRSQEALHRLSALRHSLFRHSCSYFPRIIDLIEQKQDRQYTYNVTVRRVNVIIVVVQKQ
jgi:hypothetical protein